MVVLILKNKIDNKKIKKLKKCCRTFCVTNILKESLLFFSASVNEYAHNRDF